MPVVATPANTPAKPSRRGLLLGLLAAPAIVRAPSLMRIVPLDEPELFTWSPPYLANGLLTPSMIAKEAVRLMRTSNPLMHIYEPGVKLILRSLAP